MPGTEISTIGDLIDHGYTLTAWCPKDGLRPVDLDALARRYGREASYIKGRTPIRIKCAVCGARNLDYRIGTR